MAPTAAEASNSGIVTSADGERHVPVSVRADGSTRRAIKIRPGYQPPEDVKRYRAPLSDAKKNGGRGAGIPGAEGLKEDSSKTPASAAAAKNAKRREARKKAKENEANGDDNPADKENTEGKVIASSAVDYISVLIRANKTKKTETKLETTSAPTTTDGPSDVTDADAEKEKKIRNLRKKLRQARELSEKKQQGETLNPEQFAKVIKIKELINSLEALGLNVEEEEKNGSTKENGKAA